MAADPAPVCPTRIVLVRHGESNTMVARTVGGHRTCSGLSDLGRQQTERLRDRLLKTSELTADVLISSAYPRPRETAAIISPAFAGLDVVEEPGFGEHDPGPDCDGLTYDDFVQRFGGAAWETDPYALGFPGGETVAEFQLRVNVTLSHVLVNNAGSSIVIVCHGGVIESVIRRVVQAPLSGGFELHTRPTSLTEAELVRPGRWRLHRYNDAAHLDGLPSATTVPG